MGFNKILPRGKSSKLDGFSVKVLRMNPDGSVPDDNLVINGVQSHIFTYGHRNPQGIEIVLNGDMYVTEHSPSSDDKVNHLIPDGKALST